MQQESISGDGKAQWLVLHPSRWPHEDAAEHQECFGWLRRLLPAGHVLAAYDPDDGQQAVRILQGVAPDQNVLWLREPAVVLAPGAMQEMAALMLRLPAGVRYLMPITQNDLPAQLLYFTLRGFENSAAGLSDANPRTLAWDGRTAEVVATSARDLMALAPWGGAGDGADSFARAAALTAENTLLCRRALAYSMIGIYEIDRGEMAPWVPERTRDLLDVGCARGKFGALLKAQRGIRVFGVEMDRNAAAMAAERLDEVFVGDFLQLEFGRQFDCITALDVFEHLVDFRGFLRRARSLIGPGGCLVLSVPNVGFAPIVADLLAGRWDYAPSGPLCITHLRFFTEAPLRRELAENGFSIDRWEAVPGPLPQGFPDFIAGARRLGIEVDERSLATLSHNIAAVPTPN